MVSVLANVSVVKPNMAKHAIIISNVNMIFHSILSSLITNLQYIL